MTATKQYFNFHWPLPAVQYLTQILYGWDGTNGPTGTAIREWYSQPRLASSFSVDAREKITVFFVRGTNMVGYTGQEPIPPQIVNSATAENIDWVTVPYPATIPFRASWEQGVQNLIQMINDRPGKFILMGESQGAIVTSLVYNEIRYGTLQGRREDLLAGFTFGNPVREQDHTFPGGYNPGGHGVQEFHLDNTEDLWWDIANPGDIITSVPTDPTGVWISAIVTLLNDNALDPGLIIGLISSPPPNIAVLFRAVTTAVTSAANNSHANYASLPIPGQYGLSGYRIAGDEIQRLALARPVTSQVKTQTTEVLTVNFRLPLSISEVSFEALRTPCRIELWYQDRSNNWRQILDPSSLPCLLTISGASERSWFKARFKVYPIVAKKFQFRITRTPTVELSGVPYVVGIRNTLIRRNVYDRSLATTAFEDEVDILGNVISRYVRDWDAEKTRDEEPYTFWRSSPQPDPEAVVNLYLDVRQASGDPQTIDRIYLDPVYIGQQLNLYFSTDDATGTNRLNPVSLVPRETKLDQGVATDGTVSTLVDSTQSWLSNELVGKILRITAGNGEGYTTLIAANTPNTISWNPPAAVAIGPGSVYEIRGPGDQNTRWRPGQGRSSIAGNGGSYYRFPINCGPLQSQDAWIGVEWTPGFDPASPPAREPILLRAIPDDSITPNVGWRPGIVYDPSGQFQLIFNNGQSQVTFAASSSPLFVPGQKIRIVAGWSYNPKRVFISVKTGEGTEIARLDAAAASLPEIVSFDPQMEMADFMGTISNVVVKRENAQVGGGDAFQAGPEYYVSPDPVIPDDKGNIPSTTLDNALYAASFLRQEHGTGGAHETLYEDKVWTPIWRDYTTEKGMLFFPKQVTAKYLKLEFSDLTEEPYPIYDTDLEVTYKTYPVSVYQQSSRGLRLYTGQGGILGGGFISLNGVRSVNWLNPMSIANALTGIFGTRTDPVLVQTGPAFISDALPNLPLGVYSPQEDSRIEMASNLLYRREQLNPYILAENEYYTTIKAEGLIKINDYTTDIPWSAIEASNVGAIQHHKSAGSLPIRGTDWWLFPGQTLRIPAFVMEKLTATSTVTERKLTRETRVRFSTTSTHRYEKRTLKRDAALAYFAGVREVQPFSTTYINGDDPDVFSFDTYTTDWLTVNTRSLDTAISTTRKNYELANSTLDTNIGNWIASGEDWSWSPAGHWGGCARVVTDGSEDQFLLSTIQDVVEGDQIQASCRVRWIDVTSAEGATPISLGARCFSEGVETSQILWPLFDSVSYADVAADPTSTGGEDGWLLLDGTWTVPPGVDQIRISLNVSELTAGTVDFDTVYVGDGSDTTASAYKAIATTSNFSCANVEFRDSGLVRSNALWNSEQNLDVTDLAYYVEPTRIPEGFWSDSYHTWGSSSVPAPLPDPNTDDRETWWGSPFPLISITVDADRRYDGKRVLKMRRAAGAGEAGITMSQWTNIIPGALARLGVRFYKPIANNNTITLRLRRGSNGTFLHEEIVEAVAGRWNTVSTGFFEIPATDHPAEVYTLSVTLSGDDEDELYLNDAYTELALIRYFVRLGDDAQHEVTDLRYSASPTVQVSRTTPVNEMEISVAILNPKAWAYGCRVTPRYNR